jgi:hypothetical protein
MFNNEFLKWLIFHKNGLLSVIMIMTLFLPIIFLYARFGVKSFFESKYESILNENRQQAEMFKIALENNTKQSNDFKKQTEMFINTTTVSQAIIKGAFLEKMTDEEQYHTALNLCKNFGIPIWKDNIKTSQSLEAYSTNINGEYCFGFRESVIDRLKIAYNNHENNQIKQKQR